MPFNLFDWQLAIGSHSCYNFSYLAYGIILSNINRSWSYFKGEGPIGGMIDITQ